MVQVAMVLVLAALSACGGEVGGAGSAGVDAADSAGDGGVAADADDDSTGDSAGDVASDSAADAAPSCPAATGARPSRRSEHVAAYDAKAGKLVIFGGSFGVPVNCGFPTPTFESETWVFDPACDAWVEGKAKGPAGRVRATAAYVDSIGKVVVFAGRNRAGSSGPYSLLKDLWAYDAAADSWSQLSDGAGMVARFNHTMVYAKDQDALIVFAGNTSTSGLQYTSTNDVWRYRFADGAWQKLSPAGTAPSKRFFAGGVWDESRKRMVVYGGADESLFADNAKYFGDLWALDFNSDPPKWAKIDGKTTAKPDARFWGELALDASTGRYVLFAGHDDAAQGNRNDLWGFDPVAGEWGELRYGDVWNKPANGFCSFPPDFTKVDEDAPERRSGAAVTASASGLWAMGGKTDCGIIDDLFFYDFKVGAWVEKTTATVGEACIRKGGLTCNDYCF